MIDFQINKQLSTSNLIIKIISWTIKINGFFIVSFQEVTVAYRNQRETGQLIQDIKYWN